MTFARAEAFAPASMGNVGIGFDILGLAFEAPGDIVRAERRSQPGAIMVAIEGDGGLLTLDSKKNTASVAAAALLRQIDATEGVALTLIKDLPVSSGLGSSAASAVAAVVAVNALFGSPLPRPALMAAALEGEAAVSGYHLDNVAPALLGGIVLVDGVDQARVRALPVPDVHLALITPLVAVPTSQARAVLPTQIPLAQMVEQTAGVARAIDALYRDDVEALAAAMESDRVVEPARAHLIPLLVEARATAKRAGALNLVISGAGPSLCAVCVDAASAGSAMAAVTAVYDEAGIGAVGRVTRIGVEGARVLRVE